MGTSLSVVVSRIILSPLMLVIMLFGEVIKSALHIENVLFRRSFPCDTEVTAFLVDDADQFITQGDYILLVLYNCSCRGFGQLTGCYSVL